MFDPTGGHAAPEAVLIIFLMCIAGIALVFSCIIGIKNGHKKKKNIFLLSIGLLWVILTTTIGLFKGAGMFGAFLGVLVYPLIHIIFWLIFSVLHLFIEFLFKGTEKHNQSL